MPVSPWLTGLQEQTNQLIISRGSAMALNEAVFYQSWQSWMDDVLDYVGVGRHGAWGATQTIGGPFVGGARDCCWQHAQWGDFGSEGVWTGSCSALGSGAAGLSFPTTVTYNVTNPIEGGAGGDSQSASINLRANGVWCLPVRDNMGPYGVLGSPNAVADGYPEDSELELESSTTNLVSVEISGDDSDFGPSDFSLTYAVRRAVAPTYAGGLSWNPWQKGDALAYAGTGDDLTFDWVDGDPVWHEVPSIVSGATGWDGLADRDADEAPDEVVTFGLTTALSGSAPPPELSSATRNAEVALRFTLLAPRYRWIYTSTEPETQGIPPRRIFGRPDGLTHGARRTLGGGNTRQSGNRTLGSIL